MCGSVHQLNKHTHTVRMHTHTRSECAHAVLCVWRLATKPVSWGFVRIGATSSHIWTVSAKIICKKNLQNYNVGMHYNPRWRPACFASSLRPILFISKSWKGTKYQPTWSTTTPNDKIIPPMNFFKAFNCKKHENVQLKTKIWSFLLIGDRKLLSDHTWSTQDRPLIWWSVTGLLATQVARTKIVSHRAWHTVLIHVCMCRFYVLSHLGFGLSGAHASQLSWSEKWREGYFQTVFACDPLALAKK